MRVLLSTSYEKTPNERQIKSDSHHFHDHRNIMNGGPSVIRRLANEKSNIELLNSLRSNFVAAQHIEPSHANSCSHETHSLPQKLSYSDYTTWTSKDGDTLYV